MHWILCPPETAFNSTQWLKKKYYTWLDQQEVIEYQHILEAAKQIYLFYLAEQKEPNPKSTLNKTENLHNLHHKTQEKYRISKTSYHHS